MTTLTDRERIAMAMQPDVWAKYEKTGRKTNALYLTLIYADRLIAAGLVFNPTPKDK